MSQSNAETIPLTSSKRLHSERISSAARGTRLIFVNLENYIIGQLPFRRLLSLCNCVASDARGQESNVSLWNRSARSFNRLGNFHVANYRNSSRFVVDKCVKHVQRPKRRYSMTVANNGSRAMIVMQPRERRPYQITARTIANVEHDKPVSWEARFAVENKRAYTNLAPFYPAQLTHNPATLYIHYTYSMQVTRRKRNKGKQSDFPWRRLN
ncbi:uncharacterized protein LOC143178225 [Calliopsis andreniformis]|uniref:uncharacterized protein LOC143178225 n=1 Tax=Calliopsis andreniformis TaxID=337506 RepID=UPI003FCD9276